eukprot:TRINITY_DN13751_c0_g3_i2.p1 TRINITY_DN13751_c0_g3~~TRINITY_DN13751_c0_g3_i2.p1  ORF type:complete len:635 (+),score=133.66 TRINITY_DN13751_c0_g3_i2:254-2158(+)
MERRSRLAAARGSPAVAAAQSPSSPSDLPAAVLTSGAEARRGFGHRIADGGGGGGGGSGVSGGTIVRRRISSQGSNAVPVPVPTAIATSATAVASASSMAPSPQPPTPSRAVTPGGTPSLDGTATVPRRRLRDGGAAMLSYVRPRSSTDSGDASLSSPTSGGASAAARQTSVPSTAVMAAAAAATAASAMAASTASAAPSTLSRQLHGARGSGTLALNTGGSSAADATGGPSSPPLSPQGAATAIAASASPVARQTVSAAMLRRPRRRPLDGEGGDGALAASASGVGGMPRLGPFATQRRASGVVLRGGGGSRDGARDNNSSAEATQLVAASAVAVAAAAARAEAASSGFSNAAALPVTASTSSVGARSGTSGGGRAVRDGGSITRSSHVASRLGYGPGNGTVASVATTVASTAAEERSGSASSSSAVGPGGAQDDGELEAGQGNDLSGLQAHFGVSCDGCGAGPPLVGVVMKCADCEDFDLCHRCYLDRDSRHPPGHQFFSRPGIRGGLGALASRLADPFNAELAAVVLSHFMEEEMLHEALRVSVEGEEVTPAVDAEILAAEAVSRFPRIKWGVDHLPQAPADQAEECAMCLEEYQRGEEVLETPCKHYFHEACIGPWLVKSLVCPLCKGRI